jgi:hypothetical protein
MTRAFKKIATGCVSAALLLGATAYSADASYLGYGNGDAGNYDLWTEQGAGMPTHSAPHHAMAAHRVHRTAHHALKKQEIQKTAHRAGSKATSQHS